MKLNFLILFIIIGINQPIFSQTKIDKDTIFVYGPGGPAPAMQEAAVVYSKLKNVEIVVIKGPLDKWRNAAHKNADLIYSGSEFMMTNFEKEFETIINKSTVYPLYLRKSGIIVRKNNPKNINSLRDLANNELEIMVIQGSGLTGVWEDMVGRTLDMNFIRKFRKNIVFYANNSGVAKQKWLTDNSIDVWVSWNIWQISNSDAADFVEVNPTYTSYRDCGISLTYKGQKKESVLDFFEFLKSNKAKVIFNKWGWE